MKCYLVSFCFLFFSFSVFSQISEKELTSFTDGVCNCVNTLEKTNLKSCALLLKREGKNDNVISELAKIKYNYDSDLMKRIQKDLFKRCKAYGDFILSSTNMDLKAPFHSTLKQLGPQLCNSISKLNQLNEKVVDSVIVSFLQKNQNDLLAVFKTPQKTMKEVMRYAIVNCPKYRQFMLLESIK